MRLWLRVVVLCVAFVVCDAFLAALSAKTGTTGPRDSIGYRVRLAPDGMPPLQIYVEEMGRGPPVLLLHGLGASSYTWRFIAPRLAATHRVIALDLRGFGRSDKPFDQAYGVADHTAVVRAFIREANLQRVTLVGHSYGGSVSLNLAIDRRLEPSRIGRLVLIAAPVFPQKFSPGIAFLRKPVLPYIALMMVPPEITTTVALMMEKFGFDRISDRDISIYADPLSDPGGPHALIETALQIVPPNVDRLIARYPAIAKPTLVIACRDDQVVPLASAERLARTIPRARLTVLEHCDHMPTEQVPQAVATDIERFIRR